MSDADELRRLAALGADALDNATRYEATIAGLETARDAAAAEATDLRRQLEEKPVTMPSTLLGCPILDQMRGSGHDEKLTDALAFVADAKKSKGVAPPILLSSARYDFEQPRKAVSGTKLVFPFGFGDQQRAANSLPCDVRFHGKGVWWTLAESSTFDLQFSGIGFMGNKDAQFMAGGSNVLWTSKIGDVAFNGWKHVLGRPDQKLLNTACQFHGFWNTINAYDVSYTLGGSDSDLWTEGHVIGSGPAFLAPGKPHIIFDYQGKTNVGPIYGTADNSAGVLIKGNADTMGELTITGMRMEGRNINAPSSGMLLRVDGGNVVLRDCWLSYSKGNPVEIRGGRVRMYNPVYDRAAGVGPEVPWIVQSGGYLKVVDAETGTKGGTWSRRPIVQQTRAGLVVDSDPTVELVTVA